MSGGGLETDTKEIMGLGPISSPTLSDVIGSASPCIANWLTCSVLTKSSGLLESSSNLFCIIYKKCFLGYVFLLGAKIAEVRNVNQCIGRVVRYFVTQHPDKYPDDGSQRPVRPVQI